MTSFVVSQEDWQTLIHSISDLQQKVDCLSAQNNLLVQLLNSQLKQRIQPRVGSSTRGLSTSDAILHLQSLKAPSISFFEWIEQILQDVDLLDFMHKNNTCRRFDDVVFLLLRQKFRGVDSPIFSVKRHKTNYLFERDGGYRVMHEGDMKRVLLLFQCRAIHLLDLWKMSVEEDDDAGGGNKEHGNKEHGNKEHGNKEHEDQNLKHHFQEKQYATESEFIHHLDCRNMQLLRTLLRKLNTYMLNARGITF
jgi:hypothetical protein